MFSWLTAENTGTSQAFRVKSSVSMSASSFLIRKARNAPFIVRKLPDRQKRFFFFFRGFCSLFLFRCLKGLNLNGMKKIQTLMWNSPSYGTSTALNMPGKVRR